MADWIKIGPRLWQRAGESALELKGYDANLAAVLAIIPGGILVMGGFVLIPPPAWLSLKFWGGALATVALGCVVARCASFHVRIDPSEFRISWRWLGIPFKRRRAPLAKIEIEAVGPGDYGSLGIWPMRRNVSVYLPRERRDTENTFWDFGAAESTDAIMRAITPFYLRWTRVAGEESLDYAAVAAEIGFDFVSPKLSVGQICIVRRLRDLTQSSVLTIDRANGIYRVRHLDGTPGSEGSLADLKGASERKAAAIDTPARS